MSAMTLMEDIVSSYEINSCLVGHDADSFAVDCTQTTLVYVCNDDGEVDLMMLKLLRETIQVHIAADGDLDDRYHK